MQRLLTREGKELTEIPWNVYPRPQLRRADWLCLNGSWKLSCSEFETEIMVPFCAESLLSGLEKAPSPGTELHYSRSFRLPSDWNGKRVLLHFGAVSRSCIVYLNGQKICSHDNSYLPFHSEITAQLIDGENELKIVVVNDLSHKYPWGKQKLRRGGMWYTPVSGIWQSVWLEPVPEQYVSGLTISTEGNTAKICLDGVSEGEICCEGRSWPIRNGSAEIVIPEPVFWSPEQPKLYEFTAFCGEDRIESYFALRTLSIEFFGGVSRLCLNGRPYFFNGLLDQGYWSDGLYTPASPECFERDILAMKALGFNMLRKHIKIEPELFYYACDRLGMVVFQDMVNNGEYSFFHDTALPTIGITCLSDRRRNRDPETRKIFLESMEETVHLLRNHPSICCWTIFNEGWGQFCADDAYRILKQMDPSRFVDSTSGWFAQKDSDVDSLHIYFKKLRGKVKDRPLVISEFGGYSFKIPKHSFNLEKTYGYRLYTDPERFEAAVRSLYMDELLPLIKEGLSAAVYTQVSDVEDETNGMFTYDREILKLSAETFKDFTAETAKIYL